MRKSIQNPYFKELRKYYPDYDPPDDYKYIGIDGTKRTLLFIVPDCFFYEQSNFSEADYKNLAVGWSNCIPLLLPQNDPYLNDKRFKLALLALEPEKIKDLTGLCNQARKILEKIIYPLIKKGLFYYSADFYCNVPLELQETLKADSIKELEKNFLLLKEADDQRDNYSYLRPVELLKAMRLLETLSNEEIVQAAHLPFTAEQYVLIDGPQIVESLVIPANVGIKLNSLEREREESFFKAFDELERCAIRVRAQLVNSPTAFDTTGYLAVVQYFMSSHIRGFLDKDEARGLCPNLRYLFQIGTVKSRILSENERFLIFHLSRVNPENGWTAATGFKSCFLLRQFLREYRGIRIRQIFLTDEEKPPDKEVDKISDCTSQGRLLTMKKTWLLSEHHIGDDNSL